LGFSSPRTTDLAYLFTYQFEISFCAVVSVVSEISDV
jgi:hypothetical protein